MNNIYFTSDLHLCHDRDFIYLRRKCNSIDEMNEIIVTNWNKRVDNTDDVYVMGDLMLKDNERGKALITQLNGKIHIILGNHDTANRIAEYKSIPNIVEITYATQLKYQGYTFFLTHYPCICSNYDDDKPLKSRVISICGHTHTTDRFFHWPSGAYHVELDAHNMQVVDINQVIAELEERINHA